MTKLTDTELQQALLQNQPKAKKPMNKFVKYGLIVFGILVAASAINNHQQPSSLDTAWNKAQADAQKAGGGGFEKANSDCQIFVKMITMHMDDTRSDKRALYFQCMESKKQSPKFSPY
jgi:hypothetical protein